jgi:hypothetical protein
MNGRAAGLPADNLPTRRLVSQLFPIIPKRNAKQHDRALNTRHSTKGALESRLRNPTSNPESKSKSKYIAETPR